MSLQGGTSQTMGPPLPRGGPPASPLQGIPIAQPIDSGGALGFDDRCHPLFIWSRYLVMTTAVGCCQYTRISSRSFVL